MFSLYLTAVMLVMLVDPATLAPNLSNSSLRLLLNLL